MNPGQPPSFERQEDGVSQEHNSSAANRTAPGGAAIWEEEGRGEGELRLSKGKRTKRTKGQTGHEGQLREGKEMAR